MLRAVDTKDVIHKTQIGEKAEANGTENHTHKIRDEAGWELCGVGRFKGWWESVRVCVWKCTGWTELGLTGKHSE